MTRRSEQLANVSWLLAKHLDRMSDSVNDPTNDEPDTSAETRWTKILLSFFLESDPDFKKDWQEKEGQEAAGPNQWPHPDEEDGVIYEPADAFFRRIRDLEMECYVRSACRQGIIAKTAAPFGSGTWDDEGDEA